MRCERKSYKLKLHFHIVDRSRRHRWTCVLKLHGNKKKSYANCKYTDTGYGMEGIGHTDEYAVGCCVYGRQSANNQLKHLYLWLFFIRNFSFFLLSHDEPISVFYLNSSVRCAIAVHWPMLNTTTSASNLSIIRGCNVFLLYCFVHSHNP